MDIEELKQLCRDYGWLDVGGTHDLVRWLRSHLGDIENLHIELQHVRSENSELHWQLDAARDEADVLRRDLEQLRAEQKARSAS